MVKRVDATAGCDLSDELRSFELVPQPAMSTTPATNGKGRKILIDMSLPDPMARSGRARRVAERSTQLDGVKLHALDHERAVDDPRGEHLDDGAEGQRPVDVRERLTLGVEILDLHRYTNTLAVDHEHHERLGRVAEDPRAHTHVLVREPSVDEADVLENRESTSRCGTRRPPPRRASRPANVT